MDAIAIVKTLITPVIIAPSRSTIPATPTSARPAAITIDDTLAVADALNATNDDSHDEPRCSQPKPLAGRYASANADNDEYDAVNDAFSVVVTSLAISPSTGAATEETKPTRSDVR